MLTVDNKEVCKREGETNSLEDNLNSQLKKIAKSSLKYVEKKSFSN
jgi:hypothetical protein